jgi:hypothetical protein
MCDTNNAEETESGSNEAGISSACSTVQMKQLPENDDGHFTKYWTKHQWCDKLNTYEWLTTNRGSWMFHM